MLGCDLEVVEPRSHDFVADYFTVEEQSWVARTPSAEKAEIVTLLWSAKESTLKALQYGLRLDTRSVMVTPLAGALDPDGWSPLRIGCADGRAFQGWWRTADGVVRTVATDSTAGSPFHLALPETPFHAAQALDLGVRSRSETRLLTAS
jgi:4'-phosphopantetheinyl transferase